MSQNVSYTGYTKALSDINKSLIIDYRKAYFIRGQTMNNFTDNTEEMQKETKPQLYKPGESGNPSGRPKGSLNYTTLLDKAINDYETETGRDLFKRFVERAYTNDRVLIALMKKFIPDKTADNREPPEPIEIVIHHTGQ